MSFSFQKTEEFYQAVEEGNLVLVESLSLDPSVNLNTQGEFGHTPFFIACLRGHVDITRFLLDFSERSIDYNLPNENGSSPFLSACAHGHLRLVEQLLADGRINVNQANEQGKTPLWCAAAWGNLEVIKLLLGSGRQIEVGRQAGTSGKTAAMKARKRGNIPGTIWNEAEGETGRRQRRCLEVAELLEDYEKDPETVRWQLVRELGLDEPMAADLFALVVFLSDGYLKIPEDQ